MTKSHTTGGNCAHVMLIMSTPNVQPSSWACSCWCPLCHRKIVELRQIINDQETEIKELTSLLDTIDSQLIVLTNNFDQIEQLFKSQSTKNTKKSKCKLFPISNESTYNRSCKLQEIYNDIQECEWYESVNIDKQTIDDNLNAWKISIECFLRINNEKTYVNNPNININNLTINSGNVCEKYEIDEKNNENITALNGQIGLKSKIDIPKYTTIGQYFGNELLPHEFQQIHMDDKEYLKCCSCAFEANFISTERVEPNAIIVEQARDELQKFIIDPYRITCRPNVTYINDCRKDLLQEQTSYNDWSRVNVKCVGAEIKGWPMVFMITTKNVCKGDTFWTHYGSQYHLLMKNKVNCK